MLKEVSVKSSTHHKNTEEQGTSRNSSCLMELQGTIQVFKNCSEVPFLFFEVCTTGCPVTLFALQQPQNCTKSY